MQKCQQCGRKFDPAAFGGKASCPVCAKGSGNYRRCPVCKSFNHAALENCSECKLSLQGAVLMTPAGIAEQYPVLLVSLTEKGKKLVEG